MLGVPPELRSQPLPAARGLPAGVTRHVTAGGARRDAAALVSPQSRLPSMCGRSMQQPSRRSVLRARPPPPPPPLPPPPIDALRAPVAILGAERGRQKEGSVGTGPLPAHTHTRTHRVVLPPTHPRSRPALAAPPGLSALPALIQSRCPTPPPGPGIAPPRPGLGAGRAGSGCGPGTSRGCRARRCDCPAWPSVIASRAPPARLHLPARASTRDTRRMNSN